MQNIVEHIKNKVKSVCDIYEQKASNNIWSHLQKVATISESLAREFGANIEIVVISAYLHDISLPLGIGTKENHHIESAQIAEEWLSELYYSTEQIEHVKKCILNHRGNTEMKKRTVEELCIADADVISHFYSLPGIFQVAYGLNSLTTEQGEQWIRKKLNNDFEKLSQSSKELYVDRYNAIINVLFNCEEQ